MSSLNQSRQVKSELEIRLVESPDRTEAGRRQDYYSRLDSEGQNPNGFVEKFRLPQEVLKKVDPDWQMPNNEYAKFTSQESLIRQGAELSSKQDFMKKQQLRIKKSVWNLCGEETIRRYKMQQNKQKRFKRYLSPGVAGPSISAQASVNNVKIISNNFQSHTALAKRKGDDLSGRETRMNSTQHYLENIPKQKVDEWQRSMLKLKKKQTKFHKDIMKTTRQMNTFRNPDTNPALMADTVKRCSVQKIKEIIEQSNQKVFCHKLKLTKAPMVVRAEIDQQQHEKREAFKRRQKLNENSSSDGSPPQHKKGPSSSYESVYQYESYLGKKKDSIVKQSSNSTPFRYSACTMRVPPRQKPQAYMNIQQEQEVKARAEKKASDFREGRALISQIESSIGTGQNTGRINPLSLQDDSLKSEDGFEGETPQNINISADQLPFLASQNLQLQNRNPFGQLAAIKTEDLRLQQNSILGGEKSLDQKELGASIQLQNVTDSFSSLEMENSGFQSKGILPNIKQSPLAAPQNDLIRRQNSNVLGSNKQVFFSQTSEVSFNNDPLSKTALIKNCRRPEKFEAQIKAFTSKRENIFSTQSILKNPLPISEKISHPQLKQQPSMQQPAAHQQSLFPPTESSCINNLMSSTADLTSRGGSVKTERQEQVSKILRAALALGGRKKKKPKQRSKQDDKLHDRLETELQKFEYFRGKMHQILQMPCDEKQVHLQENICNYILNMDLASMDDDEKDFIVNKIGDIVNEDQLLLPVRQNILRYISQASPRARSSTLNGRESSVASSDSGRGSLPDSRRQLSPTERRALLSSRAKMSLKNLRRSKLSFDNPRSESAATSQMSMAFKPKKSKGLQALEKVYKEFQSKISDENQDQRIMSMEQVIHGGEFSTDSFGTPKINLKILPGQGLSRQSTKVLVVPYHTDSKTGSNSRQNASVEQSAKVQGSTSRASRASRSSDVSGQDNEKMWIQQIIQELEMPFMKKMSSSPRKLAKVDLQKQRIIGRDDEILKKLRGKISFHYLSILEENRNMLQLMKGDESLLQSRIQQIGHREVIRLRKGLKDYFGRKKGLPPQVKIYDADSLSDNIDLDRYQIDEILFHVKRMNPYLITKYMKYFKSLLGKETSPSPNNKRQQGVNKQNTFSFQFQIDSDNDTENVMSKAERIIQKQAREKIKKNLLVNQFAMQQTSTFSQMRGLEGSMDKVASAIKQAQEQEEEEAKRQRRQLRKKPKKEDKGPRILPVASYVKNYEKIQKRKIQIFNSQIRQLVNEEEGGL